MEHRRYQQEEAGGTAKFHYPTLPGGICRRQCVYAGRALGRGFPDFGYPRCPDRCRHRMRLDTIPFIRLMPKKQHFDRVFLLRGRALMALVTSCESARHCAAVGSLEKPYQQTATHETHQSDLPRPHRSLPRCLRQQAFTAGQRAGRRTDRGSCQVSSRGVSSPLRG